MMRCVMRFEMARCVMTSSVVKAVHVIPSAARNLVLRYLRDPSLICQ